jgi:hypothetical protein
VSAIDFFQDGIGALPFCADAESKKSIAEPLRKA